MKFYKCLHCGNIVEMIKDANVPLFCCGEKMMELIPGSIDGAKEKHIPLIKEDDGLVTVNVGEIDHPMLPEHYIEWIIVHTDRGIYRKHLKPNDKPEAKFALLENEIVLSSYAYCNLHGLWKKVN